MRIPAAVLAAGLAIFAATGAAAHDVRVVEVATPALPGTYYPIARGMFAHHHHHRPQNYVFVPSTVVPAPMLPAHPCGLKDLERECSGASMLAAPTAYAVHPQQWLALGQAGVAHERGMVRFGCAGCLYVPHGVTNVIETVDYVAPRRPMRHHANAKHRPAKAKFKAKRDTGLDEIPMRRVGPLD